MNPLHLPRIVRAAIALATATTVIVAPVGVANAAECDSGGRFAVGGYPHTEQVPDGYTYVPTPGGIFPWDAGGFNHGQTVGAANVVAVVDEYAASCGGPIRIRGYSYGAAIVHTALETIDQRPYAPRAHVELAGNPRRPGGIEDRWQWLPPILGVDFRGAGIAPKHVASFSDRCHRWNDYVCHAPHPLNIAGGVSGSIGYGSTGGHYYPWTDETPNP